MPRGGKREGAGRKKGSGKQWGFYTFRISPENRAWLQDKKAEGCILGTIINRALDKEKETS